MQRYKLWFEYGGLAVLILLPLLLPGYILAFDMAWGPVRPLPTTDGNTWLLQSILGALGAVVPAWIVQKLVLLVVFTLGGVGAHKLARFIRGSTMVPVTAYAVGILYVCNPFVYTRFVTGQWLVLAGWALLPWAVAAVWNLARKPGLRTAGIAAAWLAAVGLTSIHTAGILVLVVPVLLVSAGREAWRERLLWAGTALLAALAINLRWVLPALTGTSNLGDKIAGFDGNQLAAFASLGSIFGNVPLSTFLLQGFWADGQNRYALPSQGGWPWGIAVFLLLALISVGVYRLVRQRDRLGFALVGLGMVAWLLAMGNGWPVTAPIAGWLHDNVPFYAGFREPHKWLMVLALAFAYSFGHGVMVLHYRMRVASLRSLRLPAVGLALLVPFVFAGIMLYGAGGQLHAASYPTGWAEAKRVVDERPQDSPLVVLPWHMYLPVSFAGRTIANPAPHYFKGQVITGNDPELRGLKADESDELTTQIAAFALRRDPRGLQAMREAGVEYVLLIKEADWRRYEWLGQTDGLREIQNTDSTRLYRIEARDVR